MITMATNPFRESMGQRVTCIGALHPHKYTKCIPHSRNNQPKTWLVRLITQRLTRDPRKEGMGTWNIPLVTVKGLPPKSLTSCISVEVTTYKDIHVRYVLRGNLLKAMQRLEEYRPGDKLKLE